jgi:hypothetical protein
LFNIPIVRIDGTISYGRYIGFDNRLTSQEKAWNFTQFIEHIKSDKLDSKAKAKSYALLKSVTPELSKTLYPLFKSFEYE